MAALQFLDRLPASIESVLRRSMIAIVRGYRMVLSPWLGSACRFTPTCSAYALEALDTHGAYVGARLAAWRILRCHPLCAGGHDPVPPIRARIQVPDNETGKSSQ